MSQEKHPNFQSVYCQCGEAHPARLLTTPGHNVSLRTRGMIHSRKLAAKDWKKMFNVAPKKLL